MNDETPAMYKIEINGIVASSGVALQKDLQKISVQCPDSGINKVKIQINENFSEKKVRVINGWLSILPPIIAIIIALLTREVISSLFIGIWFGATLIFDYNPLLGFLRALDKFLLSAMADSAHAAIIIFSCSLGGMVGIINKTGGMQGIVNIISRMVRGPRSAQFATWMMGILIFFDDYTNTLIVGNSMRPVTDTNKISREKLSYLVDSTAAPVAGIAVLSTWIGYEIGLIRQAYVDLGIAETNFYGVFLQTIPYRFYCLLTLFFVFVVCVSRRDFGPMLTAERRATNEGKVLADGANPISSPEACTPVLPEEMPKRWYNAAIPIAIVLCGTFIGLLADGGMFSPHYDAVAVFQTGQSQEGMQTIKISSISGDTRVINGFTSDNGHCKIRFSESTTIKNSDGQPGTAADIESIAEGSQIQFQLAPTTMETGERIRIAFSGADSTRVLIWVSIIGSIVALLLGLIQGLIKFEEGAKAWVDGVRTLSMAVCIMILAWTINSICTELGTARFVVAMVTDVMPYWMLPSAIFVIACFISFSTGTSWGTMAILLPISIPLAYHLNMQHYKDVIAATPNAPEMMVYLKSMILVSIGAVLEGSIFGDHCSPISDTTIMSSMASGSDHIDHVKTQAPYAVIVAIASIFFCYIPAGMGFSPYLLIVFSALILSTVLMIHGKTAEAQNKI